MKKPNITPGEWYAIDYAGYVNIQDKPYYDNHCDVLDIDHHKEAHANADFICKCKSIFEKNYNIEAIEEMYEILVDLVCWDESYPPQKIYSPDQSKQLEERITAIAMKAKQALKNARYED